MKRFIRAVALALATFSMVFAAAPPQAAHADFWSYNYCQPGAPPDCGPYPWSPTAHWGWYWFNGSASNYRAFYIADETGNAYVQHLLSRFVQDWNNLAYSGLYVPHPDTGSHTNLPVVNWYADTANPNYGTTNGAACGAVPSSQFTVLSQVHVCYSSQLPSQTLALSNPEIDGYNAIRAGIMRLNVNRIPGMSEDCAYSTVQHEFGHIMGLFHADQDSAELSSIMQPILGPCISYQSIDQYAFQVRYNVPMP